MLALHDGSWVLHRMILSPGFSSFRFVSCNNLVVFRDEGLCDLGVEIRIQSLIRPWRAT